MNFIKTLIIVAVAATFGTHVFAQTFNDVNNVQVRLNKYDNLDGSPFLTDDWSKGTVKLAGIAKVYNNLLLKYNQEEDQLYFKGDNDVTLAFTDPVQEFTINYTIDGVPHTSRYKNGYKNIAGTIVNSFFEVVADGRTQLLKKTFKTITEQKAYGAPTTERKITSNVKYFIYTDGKATPVKLNNKAVLSALSDKQAQVQTYANSNKLRFNNEDDLIKIIEYYNSI